MECTHPVLYSHGGALQCHICGAVLSLADKPTPAEKPREGPQKPAQRGRKPKAD